MKYSKTIKIIRSKLFLTQSEFAELLGVSYETVNRWENDKNEPSMKIKRKIRSIIEEKRIEVDFE